MPEVRPIDANALSKQIKNLQRDFKKSPAKQYVIKILLSMLNDRIQTPTLNYDAVVHCKDCKYFTNNIADKNLRENFCNRIEADCFHSVEKNDFCSYGAKKDEGVNK